MIIAKSISSANSYPDVSTLVAFFKSASAAF